MIADAPYIGGRPDLVNLFSDPDFLSALQLANFYKQEFDEFLRRKAVIFGYKAEVSRNSNRRSCGFAFLPACRCASIRALTQACLYGREISTCDYRN
jgi:hypothetical protein